MPQPHSTSTIPSIPSSPGANLHSSATGPKINSRHVSTPDSYDPDSYDEWRLIDVDDREETIHLDLRLVGPVDIARIRNFTESNHAQPIAYDPEPVRRALHIVMTKCIEDRNVIHLNANKFFVKHAHAPRSRGTNAVATLQAFRLCHYKIKAGMAKILLNVTSVTSAFWNTLHVNEVLASGLGTIDNNLSSLKGVKVHNEYRRDKKGRGSKDSKVNGSINDEHAHIKRIRGFGEAVNQQMFGWTPKDEIGNPTGSTQRISVADYL
jgi:hypothetical protein